VSQCFAKPPDSAVNNSVEGMVRYELGKAQDIAYGDEIAVAHCVGLTAVVNPRVLRAIGLNGLLGYSFSLALVTEWPPKYSHFAGLQTVVI
jgi:hypothetical protein